MLRALFILGVTSSTLGCIFPSAGGCGCGGGGGCAAPAPLPPPPPPPPPPAPICPPPSLCLPPICPPTCQQRAPSCGGGGCGAAPSCGGGSCGGGGGGGGCSGGSGCGGGGGGGGYVAPGPLPFLGGPIGGGGGYAPQPQPFIPSGGYAAPVQQQPAQELVSTYSETPAAWPQQAPQQAPVANYAPQQVPQQAPAANYAPQQVSEGSQSVSSISTAVEEAELHAQNNQAASGAEAHAQNNMAGSDVDEHDDLTSDSESQSPDPPNEESEIVVSHESEGTVEQSFVQPSSQEIEEGHFDVTTSTSTSTHPTLRPDPDEKSKLQDGDELTEEHEISTTVRAPTHDELGSKDDNEEIAESVISTTVIPPIHQVSSSDDGNDISEEQVISTTERVNVPFRELSNSNDYEELNGEQEISTTKSPAAEHHQTTFGSAEHELHEEQEFSTTLPAAEHHQATEPPTTQDPFDALEQSERHREIVHKLRDDKRYHEVRTTTEVPPREDENAGYSSQLASEEEDTDERLRTQLDEISDLAAALGEKPNNQLNNKESEFEVKEIISDVLRRRKLLLKRKRPLDLEEGELPTYYSETYQQIAPAVRTQEISSYSQGSGVAAGSTVQEVAERSAPTDDEDDRDSSAYKEEGNEQTKVENTREAKPAKSAEQRDDRVSEVSETPKEPSPALSDDPLCNNDDLRKLMIENMDNNLNASKRLIQLAAESQFGGRFDVICANGDFSYVTNTELYCQESKADVSCYSYRQLS